MGKLLTLALRAVLSLALAGSLFIQVRMVPLISADLEEAGTDAGTRILALVIMVLGIATIQVTLACVWRLTTMARRGTVFSQAAFRYVDVVFGAVATASVLVFALAVILAPGNAAPGIVLLICGASVLIGGAALVVLVLRALLAQAVARDVEANHLRAELGEVI